MSKNMLRSLVFSLILFACLLASGKDFPVAPGKALLPQTRPYMKVLRNWMGTLVEDDFRIEQPVDAFLVKPDALKTLSNDALYRLYIFSLSYNLRSAVLPADFFLLSTFEDQDTGTIYMGSGRGALMGSTDGAVLYAYDYPGNPCYQNRALAMRMAVAIATELCVYVEIVDSGKERNTQLVGGQLMNIALPYFYIRHELPPEVQKAMDQGMRILFEFCESAYPAGHGGGNMESFQVVGMYYVAEALNDDDLRARALKKAHSVWDLIETYAGGALHRHGFDNDGDGGEHRASHATDLSYEGIQQYHFAWAAHLYQDEALTRKVEKSFDIMARMTFPEPENGILTRQFAFPSHFNDGTDTGARQWGFPYAEIGMALLSDVPRYLLWTGVFRLRIGKDGYLPDRKAMIRSIEGTMKKKMKRPSSAPASEQKKYAYEKSRHSYSEGANWTALIYQDGAYAMLQKTKPELRILPVERKENYIKNYGDDIIVAKFDAYSAMIHTGAIRNTWAEGLPGFGGGALSVFWDPIGGTSLLGCSRGTQGGNHDGWSDKIGNPKASWYGWDKWATHHIGGLGNDNKPFSSARNRFPERTVTIDGQKKAIVTVTGNIGRHDHAYSAPKGAIKGDVTYTRTFSLTPQGVTISSQLNSDGSDQCSELWEFLPIRLSNLRDTAYSHGKIPPAIIEYRQKGQTRWEPLTNQLVNNVLSIRRKRFGSSTVIVFDESREIRLSDADYKSRTEHIAVLMVKLHAGGGSMPKDVGVRYGISTTGASADEIE